MHPIPHQLRLGPFSRARGLAQGITPRVLEGVQFRRLHQSVYVHRDHSMTWHDHVEAARLALPSAARTTGVTRLRQLGFDVGPPFPVHFVIEGDHHLVLDGVFLHRTVKMPPFDDAGVSVEAAFVASCAQARLIDAIGWGSHLLHKRWLDLDLLDQILSEETWRRGVLETSYAVPFLDGSCRSVPEAELLACVIFSGLPLPAVNQTVALRDGTLLTPDQWFEDYDVAVEYDGSQHLEDRGQYNADIDRYAAYRRNDVSYEQVTKELMRSPKAAVRRVHAALVGRGYEGPAPDFEGAWPTLFAPLSDVVRVGAPRVRRW